MSLVQMHPVSASSVGSDNCKFLITRQTTELSEVLHRWHIRPTGIMSSANFLTNQVGTGSREQCLAGTVLSMQ